MPPIQLTPPTYTSLLLYGAAQWRCATAVRPLERKQAALLAYLWLEGPTSRSRLAGLLWPEVADERARGNLRQRLLKLRKEAGELIHETNGLLSVAATLGFDGPETPGAELLAGFHYDDCEDFARWLERRRDDDRARHRREWLARARAAVQAMRLDDALFAAESLLQADRESEEAFRMLMEVFYLRGDQAAALAAWDRCREMLRQLYGVPPSAATRQLGEAILAAANSASAAPASPSASGTDLPVTLLRPPRLVGRASALHLLIDGWQAGDALCVAGESGIGKTRLLLDWIAVTGPCALAVARPGDSVLPYASLGRLITAAIDRFAPPLGTPDVCQAARLLPRLATIAGLSVVPAQTEYERTQALVALARLFRVCVQLGCCAFVLDDLQFADSLSLAALRVLAEPGAQSADSLRFAFAVRPDEVGSDAKGLLDSLAATRRWRRLDLGPLAPTQAGELLASLGLPAIADAALAAKLWRQVGGNPAFLLESVKLLVTTGTAMVDIGAPPLPPSIEAVVQRRIELLSPRARHLAQLAAIAGGGYSILLAASALACAPLELSDPMRELELRQVMYGQRFVHDVIAVVAHRSVPAAVAAFMHRFVAEYLAQHGGEPALIATHWQACGEWRQAGRWYVEAAVAARRASQINAQGELLSMAIAAFEQDDAANDELFAALLERTEAIFAQGFVSKLPVDVQRLQGMARDDAQRLQALAAQARFRTEQTKTIDLDETRAAIEHAVSIGRSDLALPLASALGSQLAMAGLVDEGLAAMRQHETWVDTQGDPRVTAMYRSRLSYIHMFGDQLVDAIAEEERAMAALHELEDWPLALPCMSNIGMMRYWRGEFELAKAMLVDANALRERLHGRGQSVEVDIHLGNVLRDLGETEAAHQVLSAALTYLGSQPDNEMTRHYRVISENQLAQLWLMRGEPALAATLLATESAGIADRYRATRLKLRLRLQRCFGEVDLGLRDELRALTPTLPAFNRLLAELELARLLPAAEAPAEYARMHDSPAAKQRPGLQLHAAAMAAEMTRAAGEKDAAMAWISVANELKTRCHPFDIDASEVNRILA